MIQGKTEAYQGGQKLYNLKGSNIFFPRGFNVLCFKIEIIIHDDMNCRIEEYSYKLHRCAGFHPEPKMNVRASVRNSEERNKL